MEVRRFFGSSLLFCGRRAVTAAVSTLRVDAHDIGLLALFRTGTRIGVDPNPKASSNYERESKAESIRLMRSSTRVNHSTMQPRGRISSACRAYIRPTGWPLR